MGRIAMVVAAGFPHHVTQRGNRRQTTFFCERIIATISISLESGNSFYQVVQSSHRRLLFVGHIRETLGLRRFSLRGKAKVNGQWQLMTMLHNIFKIHRYGWAV